MTNILIVLLPLMIVVGAATVLLGLFPGLQKHAVLVGALAGYHLLPKAKSWVIKKLGL